VVPRDRPSASFGGDMSVWGSISAVILAIAG
jgi:hypothetical protein